MVNIASVVYVQGSAYQQGLEQGCQLGKDVAHNVELIHNFLRKKDIDLTFMQKVVATNIRYLEEKAPRIIEEYHGLAAGSGIAFETIALLNTPVYFLTDYLQQGCSMLLARKKATADSCTYLIKNRDIHIKLRQTVLSRYYENGRRVIEQNSAGIIVMPGIGINESGLALSTTGSWPKYAGIDFGEAASRHMQVNINLLLQECQTVQQVIDYMKDLPRMTGMNLIAVDSVEAAILEITRDRLCFEMDDGSGILYRCNHYVLPGLSSLNNTDYASTFQRYQRIGELVEQQYGKLRFQDMLRIMSDHAHGINSICRHGEALGESKTVCSSIAVLEDRELWTIFDTPCTGWQCSRLKNT